MGSCRDNYRRAALPAAGILLSILLLPHALNRLPPGPEATAAAAGALVRTIDTSRFMPPSPDPSSLVYLPDSGTILLGDGEVDETAIFEGKNLFEISLAGEIVSTASTMEYTPEPVGLALDRARNWLYVTDDNVDGFYTVKPGPDGKLHTSDDQVSFYNTAAYGGTDPEDIAFDETSGHLLVLDGRGDKVYRLSPGANGAFDGVPPAGDDEVTFFETSQFGIMDPEGLTIDPVSRHIFFIGQPPNRVVETSISGQLMGALDITEVNPVKPSALAIAPGSLNPEIQSLYIADRGIDNAEDPDENDGRIYELSLPLIPGNRAPRLDAGPDLEVELPSPAILRGSAVDDGKPEPPGRLTVKWKQVTGKGTVRFDDAAAPETSASFSSAGEYILRLHAADGDFSEVDECRVLVSGTRGEEAAEARVAAGSDDAVERSGAVNLSGSNLRMVFDRGFNQTVGLRFERIEVPRHSAVINAYIQFQADAVSIVETALTLRGEAADDAKTFTTDNGGITARLKTQAAVAWVPEPWEVAGERGVDQRTSDLAPILEEIVSRPGWTAGNSMALIITGSGQRVASSFEKNPEAAPVLFIEYIPSDRLPFRRGDVNGDRSLDISDPVRILILLFLGEGEPFGCLEAADMNDDLSVDISDAIYELDYLFLGGPPPPPPFRECRPDPAPETLGCDVGNCDETP